MADSTNPDLALCEYAGQWTLPCCAPAVCGIDGGGYKLCCFQAGEPCGSELECCSGSCTAGVCD